MERQALGAGHSPSCCTPLTSGLPLAEPRSAVLLLNKAVPARPLAGLGTVPPSICGDPGAHCQVRSREQGEKERPFSCHNLTGSRLRTKGLPSFGHKRATAFRGALGFNFYQTETPYLHLSWLASPFSLPLGFQIVSSGGVETVSQDGPGSKQIW